MRGDRKHQGRGRGRGGRGGPHRGNRWRGGFRGEKSAATGGIRERGKGNERPQNTMAPRLSEDEVGITEFIGQHDGFKAVMKHRFSDFHVNEIDCDGNVVKLTSLEVPIEEQTPILRHELIPEEVWERISNMVLMYTKSKCRDSTQNRIAASSGVSKLKQESPQVVPDKICEENRDPPASSEEQSTDTESVPQKEESQSVELDVTTMDKDSRRAIHTCVKLAFKEVNSNTVDRDGKKFVTFSVGGARDNRGKWPASRKGEYLHFVVHKRNMDTSDTVNLISEKLWLKPNTLTFAGTKDKRAITSQLMCIRRGEPSRLFNLSKGLQNIYLGNYVFKEKSLKLGDLMGNQFRIALRFVDGSDEQINSGLESLRNNGFINYYGLQRFGTNKAVPTHCIGKALFLGDWEKAVDLILQPRDSFPVLKSALDEWRSNKDAKAALRKLPRSFHSLEECLLQGLEKHGSKDFVNALSMVPRNTRLMYLHAYQSLIWNKSVSQRIKEFGFQPVVGDLVLVKSEKESNEEECESLDTSLLSSSEVEIAERLKKQEVQYITENNITDFKMQDIVLPLPGCNIVYPSNSIGDFMRNLLKEDGLSCETKQHNVKQYNVGGTYRHIIAKVDKLDWEIIKFKDSEKDLILGDYEELKERTIMRDQLEDANYKAIILSMCLEPSTYATMAIREVTKTDTSAFTQASMSAASVDVENIQSTEVILNEASSTTENMATEDDIKEESDDAQVCDSDTMTAEKDTVVENENKSVKRKINESLGDEIAEKKLKET
ncbi:Pseudouridylate synthase 7-like protein [Frankliniella fusca]|uniref:Pseudouridylate synthase 7-like protein n=1 Tax=Frankliniella fusca TaxID=407009 RepID=A0AAE1HSU3_9NEOP|nr:Pseudouridylate synthase 7-like protein [Frankliniella fusca]